MLLWGQALSKITSTGAMTYCFIQAIERGHASTYGSMLNSMRSVLRSTGSNDLGGGVVTSLLTMLLTGGSTLSGGLRQVFAPWCYISSVYDFYSMIPACSLGSFSSIKKKKMTL